MVEGRRVRLTWSSALLVTFALITFTGFVNATHGEDPDSSDFIEGIVKSSTGEPIDSVDVWLVEPKGNEVWVVHTGPVEVVENSFHIEVPSVPIDRLMLLATETIEGEFSENAARSMDDGEHGAEIFPENGTLYGVEPLPPNAPDEQVMIRLDSDRIEPHPTASTEETAARETVTRNFEDALNRPYQKLDPITVQQSAQQSESMMGHDASSLTVQFLVNDMWSTPWPISVPYPADVNQDNIVDGFLEVEIEENELIGGTFSEFCFASDFELGNTFHDLSGRVGVAYQGHLISWRTEDIPDQTSICIEFVDDEIKFRTASTGNDESFRIEFQTPTGEGVADFQDQVPHDLEVGLLVEAGSPVQLEYEASRSHSILLFYESDTAGLWADIDSLPTALSATFEAPTGSSDQFHINSEASESLDSIQVILYTDAIFRADAMFLASGVPSEFETTFQAGIDASPQTMQLEHRASSPTDSIYIEAGDVRLWGEPAEGGWVYMEDLPSTVTASGEVKAQDGVMETLDLQSMMSNGLPILEIKIFSSDSEALFALRDVPTWFFLETSSVSEDGTAATPRASYVASSSGAQVLGYASGGFLEGGEVTLAFLDIPTRLEATTSPGGISETQVLHVNTDETGPLGLLFFDFYLPGYLDDTRTDEVMGFFEDIEDLRIAQKKPVYAPCLACSYWSPRDAGYFEILHGELSLGWIGDRTVYWRVDSCDFPTVSLCDSLLGWSAEYFIHTPNVMVHEPEPPYGPGDPTAHMRAAIWKGW